jgi:hypothetical protein
MKIGGERESERNTCRVLVGKLKGNDNSQDLGIYGG